MGDDARLDQLERDARAFAAGFQGGKGVAVGVVRLPRERAAALMKEFGATTSLDTQDPAAPGASRSSDEEAGAAQKRKAPSDESDAAQDGPTAVVLMLAPTDPDSDG